MGLHHMDLEVFHNVHLCKVPHIYTHNLMDVLDKQCSSSGNIYHYACMDIQKQSLEESECSLHQSHLQLVR